MKVALRALACTFHGAHFVIPREGERPFSSPAMAEVLHHHLASSASTDPSASSSRAMPGNGEEEEGSSVEIEREDGEAQQRLSVLALLVAVFRKSWVACKSDGGELCGMEIGWPTNVRHVAHVTFDRFDGFLGLPVEFEPEVPRRAPSARYIAVFCNLDCLKFEMLGSACVWGNVSGFRDFGAWIL